MAAVLKRLVYQLRRRWAQRHTYKCAICDGCGTVMLPNELTWTWCFCCDGEGRHPK